MSATNCLTKPKKPVVPYRRKGYIEVPEGNPSGVSFYAGLVSVFRLAVGYETDRITFIIFQNKPNSLDYSDVI
jgi:hypothetical protein